MSMKETLLVLEIFVMVIAAFVLAHVAGHLTWLLENCFALVLPALRW